ncbi:MAG: hypothetical protein JOZ58_19990 [Acetobacteraceae bacterium]|nr:hypothetical protein [Acetobacteraceae bacterium]
MLAQHGDDAPEPEPKKRREDGDGEFQKLVAKFSRHLIERQFRTQAKEGLRYLRVIRLSRAAWGAPDAHLQNTLNLFDQINSRAPAEPAPAKAGKANNSRAPHSHSRAPPKYHSLRR